MKNLNILMEHIEGKPVIKSICKACGNSKIDAVSEDVITLMTDCGAYDRLTAYNYKEYCLDNCYFSCFFKTTCDLCGEKRVLGCEAGNSPATTEIISPSKEFSFWPLYDYPIHRVRICKWCMPDNNDEKSRKNFLIRLFNAMLKEETDNWKWREENKR